MNIESKREDEKRVVSEMIGLYCRRDHHTKQGKLCARCEELNICARSRSDHCPFMETKIYYAAQSEKTVIQRSRNDGIRELKE